MPLVGLPVIHLRGIGGTLPFRPIIELSVGREGTGEAGPREWLSSAAHHSAPVPAIVLVARRFGKRLAGREAGWAETRTGRGANPLLVKMGYTGTGKASLPLACGRERSPGNRMRVSGGCPGSPQEGLLRWPTPRPRGWPRLSGLFRLWRKASRPGAERRRRATHWCARARWPVPRRNVGHP